jgi:hypothetical protein
MKWIIDSLIGTIESINVFPTGGAQDVKYLVISFKEYEKLHFKMFRDTAIEHGISEWSPPEGFNEQELDSLERRRAVVRVRQEKSGKNDWYIIDEFELLK